jgi:hypothetical protein
VAIKNNEMGEACGTHRKEKKCKQDLYYVNLGLRDYLEFTGVVGRIMWMRVSKK